MAPASNGDGAAKAGHVAILYGSQTGTAEEVAWDLAREGRAKGFQCGEPQALNDIDLQSLCATKFAVFVLSTTGQGDPPVNMRRLWQELLVASLPKALLAGLRFAVFGLGDSHYREFNYAARKLHARLRGLGAEAFFRLGLGDDQHDFGLEQELDPWAESMWEALAGICPPRASAPMGAASAYAEECRYKVEVLGEAPDREAARPLGPEEFEAEVQANWSLCTAEHADEQQDVRNVALLMPPGVSYEAGDVCVVWPQTDPKLVRRFVVETLELDLHTRVRIRPSRAVGADGQPVTVPFPDQPLTLEEIFTAYVDFSAVPSRHFFHVLSQYTDHEMHKKKLSEFASRTLEAKDALYEYCKRERRSAAEVMWDFWTARPPLPELLGSLPPMRPRRYSIASCPRWYCHGAALEGVASFWLRYSSSSGPPWRPKLRGRGAVRACAEALLPRRQRPREEGGEPEEEGRRLDLCVAIVRFTTKTGREGQGLCSTFLQSSRIGSSVRCSFEKGTLAPLPTSVPLIFVCPGTGLSPCRALVQHRHLQLCSSGEMQRGRFQEGLKDIMFLGFRHQVGDFLYGSEWSTYEEWLSVHVAFSRDHEDRKVYVQDCIEEHGPQVCGLLDAGAQILVCGRAHPMPAQVFDAFAEVLRLHRGLSAETAAARLREMQRTQRYVCDTWG